LIWTQPPPPPRQRSLGRDEIVAAAIGLVDEAGPAALTMKAVADRLGSYSPMALYRYVYSKEGLIDLMLDTVTTEIPVPAQPSGDWREDLHALATSTRQMITAHPWYALLIHTRAPAGPRMMRRIEFMLSVLIDEGAILSAAMTYAALIDRHIFGSGLQEAEEERAGQRHGLEHHAAFLAAVAPVHALAAADGQFPNLTNWLAHPTGPSPDEQFDLGLTFLLDGIATQLQAPTSGSAA
jgi:AcrR family transcriptional regulator